MTRVINASGFFPRVSKEMRYAGSLWVTTRIKLSTGEILVFSFKYRLFGGKGVSFEISLLLLTKQNKQTKLQNKQKPSEAITYNSFSNLNCYLFLYLYSTKVYCYLKFFSFRYFTSKVPVRRQKSCQLFHQWELNTTKNC